MIVPDCNRCCLYSNKCMLNKPCHSYSLVEDTTWVDEDLTGHEATILAIAQSITTYNRYNFGSDYSLKGCDSFTLHLLNEIFEERDNEL